MREKLKCFFLEIQNGEREGRNRRERGRIPANQVVPRHPLSVGGAWPTREQRLLQASGPTAWAVLSRAPSVRRPVSRASEL